MEDSALEHSTAHKPKPPPAPVAEPATAALLGPGLAGLYLLKRKRRRD